jgi:hypothetical protein
MARVRTVFFFRGAKYVRYDVDPITGVETVNLGVYPRDVGEGWTAMPAPFARGFDAVVSWNDGFVYFFKGSKYVRWDATNNTVDVSLYPRDISEGWVAFPATFAAGIDAAINWGDDTAFFFKGSKYIKYVMKNDTVDKDIYPRDISEGWSDFPAAFKGGVDAAVNWGDGTAYFFKATSYLAYDIAGNKVRPGFPLPMTAPLKWPALVAAGFAGPFDDVIEWPQGDVASATMPKEFFPCIKQSLPTVECGGEFRMEALFTDANPSVPACCEYRQFVRGTVKVDDQVLKYIVQDRGVAVAVLLRPRPSAGSFDDNFREDRQPASHALNTFGVDRHYGHRDSSIGNRDLNDKYIPRRRSGNQYFGHDTPNYKGPAGKFVEYDVDFRGQLIDVCNGGAVLFTKEWTVKCSVL